MSEPNGYCFAPENEGETFENRGALLNTSLEAKEAITAQHKQNIRDLCQTADHTTRALHNQRAKSLHFQEEYEEAWLTFELALQKCEDAKIPKSEIQKILNEFFSSSSSSSPSASSPSSSRSPSPVPSSMSSVSSSPYPTTTPSTPLPFAEFCEEGGEGGWGKAGNRKSVINFIQKKVEEVEEEKEKEKGEENGEEGSKEGKKIDVKQHQKLEHMLQKHSVELDKRRKVEDKEEKKKKKEGEKKGKKDKKEDRKDKKEDKKEKKEDKKEVKKEEKKDGKKDGEKKEVKGEEEVVGTEEEEEEWKEIKKARWEEGEWEGQMKWACELFNQKPRKCFEFLVENSYIPDLVKALGKEEEEEEGGKEEGKEGEGKKGEEKEGDEGEEEEESEEEMLKELHGTCCALFLLSFGDLLDQTLLGDYLSDRCDTVLNIKNIREQFFSLISLKEMTVPTALRKILTHFRLPGEAQKIERILESFSKTYYEQNPSANLFKSTDTVLILSYSLTMLNTDAHNPQVKKKDKMTQEQFVKNNRSINDGEDLPREYLEELYDDIVNNEIKIQKSDPYPRALKRGWVNMKCQSWVLYSRRWVVLSDHTLYIFKAENDPEPALDLPLRSTTISVDHKRRKMMIRSRDVKVGGNNFPVKLESDQDKDFQEWCSFILGTGKKREFRPLNYAQTLRKRSPRPIRLTRFDSARMNTEDLSEENLSQYDLDSDASDLRSEKEGSKKSPFRQLGRSQSNRRKSNFEKEERKDGEEEKEKEKGEENEEKKEEEEGN